MSTLLIVSADPSSIDKVSTIAGEMNVRVKSVTQLNDAREWLALNDYNVVMIDSRYGDAIPLEMLEYAWENNEFVIGCLFNLYGDVEEGWKARMSGARVFSGEKAETRIREMLEGVQDLYPTQNGSGVLVIEDLDAPRDIICRYIEACGYPIVDGVATVDEALAKLRATPEAYFVVVSDLNMPNKTGIDFVRELRADPMLAHLPVIILTAYSTYESLVEALEVGVTGFLAKPPQKNILKKELNVAKRIYYTKQNPRLCMPEDVGNVEELLLSGSGF